MTLNMFLYSNYHAAWWFPAVLRLLIIAKLSLDILVASYRTKEQQREKLLGLLSPS